MMANKNAITTRAIVVISKRDELAVGVCVEGEDVGVGLEGVAGMVTVCVGLLNFFACCANKLISEGIVGGSELVVNPIIACA